MSRYDKFLLASRGIARSVLKRASAVALVLMVLQLVTLQVSVNGQAERQAAENAKIAQDTAKARDKALAKALDANQKEHQRTQQYVRCLIGIVLMPLSSRPDDPQQAINQCGKDTQNGNQASTQSSSPVVVTPSPSTSTSNQPTTSAPPDPGTARNTPTPNPLIDLAPLVYGAYRTVKSVPLVGGLLP